MIGTKRAMLGAPLMRAEHAAMRYLLLDGVFPLIIRPINKMLLQAEQQSITMLNNNDFVKL